MKILFLCHRLPFPPDRGSRIRAFHLLEHLGRSHEVTVATLVRGPDEEEGVREVRVRCAKLLTGQAQTVASGWRALSRLPTPVPSSIAYFHSAQLAALVEAELANARYDLVLAHSSSMAPYVARANVPRMLDFADMDSQKWLAYARYRRFPLSVGYELEGRKLRRAEAAWLGEFDLATCATTDELDALRSYGVPGRSDWFPNGVDGDYFRPVESPPDPETVCFLGRMDYFPNVECMVRFCSETLPLLRRRRPGIRLSIVGATPARAVWRLAREPGVTVTGTVADVRPYAWRASVSVAPLQIARGTQNKILESLAMGIPVVCSTLAARGVDAMPGEHVTTADEADAFAAAILSLLENPSQRRRLAEAGRRRMLSHHSWARSMQRLDELLEECVATHRARVPR